MIDVIERHYGNGENRAEIHCLDLGVVKLIDVMPRVVDDKAPTIDAAVCQAARVSYGAGTKTVNEDRGLIRYLMRHRHTTPFEMVEFKFLIKCPIFVARQWIRHRTANINEISARYSEMKDEFYLPKPEDIRVQSLKNKQCSEGKADETSSTEFSMNLELDSDAAYTDYKDAIAAGVAREQARMILPVNLYTEFYWKIDLHNLLHFLALRADGHAQKEIRDYANAIIDLIKPLCPVVMEAWEDYHPMRGAMLLTRLEIDHLRKLLGGVQLTKYLPNIDNKRETAELLEKFAKLGIDLRPEHEHQKGT